MLMTVPSNDKIVMQKLTAYAALSSFHKMSSLPDVSLLMLSLSLLSSGKRLIFCGLEHKYNKSSLLLSSRHVETGCASTERCRTMFNVKLGTGGNDFGYNKDG